MSLVTKTSKLPRNEQWPLHDWQWQFAESSYCILYSKTVEILDMKTYKFWELITDLSKVPTIPVFVLGQTCPRMVGYIEET